MVGQSGPVGTTAAAVAEVMQIHPRTVFRHLAALRELGMIESTGTTSNRYRLGGGLVDLASKVSDQREFLRIAKKVVEDAADRLGEATHVSMYDAGASVTVAVADRGPNATTPPQPILEPGTRRAAHASASGKIFLAHRPRDLQTYLLRPLHSYTDHTIVDPALLMAELRLIHLRNWSTDEQELLEGISCLAVPVWGTKGRVVGSLVVSTQNDSIGPELRARLLEGLLPAAAEFTRAVGGQAV